MRDSAQLLDVIRDVLTQHMNNPQALPEYRVQRAIMIGKNSGRMITDNDVIAGHDAPGSLRLLMESGEEYQLTVE